MVEEAEEEKYQAKAVQFSVQGQWTKWCSYVRMDLLWKTLLTMPQQLLTFSLGAMYSTLPSPSNLRLGILTQRHHVYFVKNKFVLLPLFLGHVL